MVTSATSTFDHVFARGFGPTPDMAVTQALLNLLGFFVEHDLTVFDIRELRAAEWQVIKGESVTVQLACWLKEPHVVSVKQTVQTGEHNG